MILEIKGKATLIEGKYVSRLVTCDLQSTGLIRVLKNMMLKGVMVGVASLGIRFSWIFWIIRNCKISWSDKNYTRL